MPANFNTDNAMIATGCQIYVGDKSLALPTDETTPLPSGYRHIGHTPEGGVSIGNLRGTSTDILAADHKTTLITVYSGSGPTFDFSFAEITPKNIVEAWNATPTETGLVIDNLRPTIEKRLIIQTLDQNNLRPLRIVASLAKVTGNGPSSFNPNDLFEMPTTWTANSDDTLGGVGGHIIIFGEGFTDTEII